MKAPWSILLTFCLADPSAAAESRQESATPRKDAAEAVQEGSVANWMEYYRRERTAVPVGQKEQARTPAPGDKPASAQGTPAR